MDLAIMVTLVLAFALFVTAHVSLAFGLTLQRPRWRGPVALIVAPLAPYWGYASGMRGRVLLWGGSVAAYALARAAGYLAGG